MFMFGVNNVEKDLMDDNGTGSKYGFSTENLVNLTEAMVFDAIQEAITTSEAVFCHCDVCVQDIAALALNSTPAKYTRSDVDRYFPTPSEQKEQDRIRRIAREQVLLAIRIIQKYCHH